MAEAPGRPVTIEGSWKVPIEEIALAYTAYLPHGTTLDGPFDRVAVISHPLGRLGGSRRDHIVVSVSRVLASRGWVVLAYDSRGSGQSEGAASWTAKAEAADFKSFVDEVAKALLFPPQVVGPRRHKHLLCAGYSAGSLSAASYRLDASAFGPPGCTIKLSWLLISVPLSVLWAITVGRSSWFTAAVDEIAATNGRLLVAHGDSDQFTAVGKYRSWVQGLERLAPEAGVRVQELAGDHFWSDATAKRGLLDTIAEWSDSA